MNGKLCSLKDTLKKVRDNGGHSIRIWLHVEGDKTPQFDNNGMVIGTDSTNTLISDMRTYLRNA